VKRPRPAHDLRHCQYGAKRSPPDRAVLGEQAGDRRSAGEPAIAKPQRFVDIPPVYAWHFGDASGFRRRPVASSCVVGVRPRQDALDGEKRSLPDAARSPLLPEEVSQQNTPGEPAIAISKGIADRSPGFPDRLLNPSGLGVWPRPRSGVERVGPGENR
jgi:hypothetical protein